ncbi:unnamed protein product [Parajaminaea phylloscopi]
MADRERAAEMRAPIPLPVNVDTTGAKIMEDASSHPDQRDSRDIYLPNHVETVSHIAVDIGGSLAKVVYFTRSRSNSDPQASKAGPSHDNGAASSSPPPPSAVAASPSSPPYSNGSRFHSRQSSANGVGGHPRSPSSESSMHPSQQAGSSSHPTPSGTLTPTAILSERHPPHIGSAVNAMRSSLLKRRSLPAALPGGRLNFIKFETGDIDSCVSFLQELIETSAKANRVTIEEMRRGVKLMATGGGAHLFYERFEKALGVEVQREDEMDCLIVGLNFITLIPDEVFWYSDELVSALHSPLPQSYESRGDPSTPLSASLSSLSSQSQPDPLPRPSPNPPLYAPMFDYNPTPKLPCLLVNIGSGVSIIKVDDFGKFERVSGTSLGGGTLWGLLSLLTDADSFDEMLDLSERGDNGAVDLLVSDVYGNSNALNAFGLKSSTIASSFGKVFRKEDKATSGGAAGRKKRFRPEDICKSLLYAVSNNIGQIAHMTAEKYDLDRIYFGGCFIRGHQATISTLSYAIRFWSKGTKRAFFLRHEGYLGAIGAWIKHLDDPPVVLQQQHQQRQTTVGAQGQRAHLPQSIAASPIAGASSRPVTPQGNGNPNGNPNGARARQQSGLSSNGIPAPSVTSPPNTFPTASPPSAQPQPAKAMETSGLVPTPIEEFTEPTYRTGAVPNGDTPAASQPPAPATRPPNAGNPDDLLSMLQSLQDDHRALLEPLVKTSAQSNGHAVPMLDGGESRDAVRGQTLGGSDEDVADALALLADGEGEGAESIQELMKKLEDADSAADGLEDKLDVLLGRLDTMLASGQAGAADGADALER